MRNILVPCREMQEQESGILYNRHENIKSVEAMQKAAARTANLQHPNGTNLPTGGSDSLLCRSMVSALNLAKKSMLKTQTTFQKTINGCRTDSLGRGKIKAERCMWVPKTMRIDNNPEEAARSLIWGTPECIKNIQNKEKEHRVDRKSF
ncbi:hypothetical protein Bca4012_019753 [Brassica carinata]